MKLRFYAVFRDIVGQREMEREFTGTVSELLKNLCDECGERFREAVFDERGELRRYVKIFVNGRNVEDLNGLETELKDADIVAIFPPIAGG